LQAPDEVRAVGWRGLGHDPRRLALLAVSILISAACLVYVLRRISLDEMVDSLRAADYVWVIPSTVLTIATMWLRGIRWRAIFERPETVSNGESFAASSVGLMFNNLLPSRAGDVIRVFVLRRASGLSAVEIGTTVVLERVFDVFVLALFGLALWPWLPDRAWIDALGVLCAGIVAGCAAVVVLYRVARTRGRALLERWLRRLPRVTPERAERLERALAAGAAVLGSPRRLAICTALSAAVWLVAGLAALVLFPAFDLDAGSLAPWLLLVANSFALVVPSSPGTVGVYEASVQASLVAFGVAPATAVSLALVLHAVNFFPVIVVGALAWWWLRRQGRG
jgi:glycosyltransferase 2 family protein